MKPLLVWLALSAVVFGGLAGAYHLYLEANPRRVAVVVDSSYPMQAAWHQVPEVLRALAARRYAEFALATQNALTHGWARSLGPLRGSPYGPRDLSRLRAGEALTALAGADERYLVTNAGPAETRELDGWKVIRLGPP